MAIQEVVNEATHELTWEERNEKARPDIVTTLNVISTRYKDTAQGVVFEVKAEGDLFPERNIQDGPHHVSVHFDLPSYDYCPRVGTGLNVTLNW